MDINNERPIHYGDQPGGRPFRRTMLSEHFPQITALLDSWDEVARCLARAPDALRARFHCELRERGLDQRPHDAEVPLVTAVTEFTRDRALRGEIGTPPNLQPNQGSIWIIGDGGARVRGGVAIDLRTVTGEDQTDRAQATITSLNGVLLAAQAWPETTDVAHARQAVVSRAADPELRDAILGQLPREQILCRRRLPGLRRAIAWLEAARIGHGARDSRNPFTRHPWLAWPDFGFPA